MNAPVLPLARYRLVFKTVDPIRLPEYAGSAWRGIFGRSLKRLVCVTREPACPPCLLYRSCVYPYIFETPPDPARGKMRKYTAAPHPFVLATDISDGSVLPADAGLELGLTLFGHGNRYLPYVVHALDQAAQRGIGRNNGRLSLERLDQAQGEDWETIFQPGAELRPLPAAMPEIPALPERLRLILETPLRIKTDGHNLRPEQFSFGPFFSTLLRRLSLLTTFHTDAPLDTDFAGLTRAARGIEIQDCRLSWYDWTRYSSRQDALMQMGGLLGSVTLAGVGLEPFWPYLWLGQWTHAGKGASMGLGRYRIEILSSELV